MESAKHIQTVVLDKTGTVTNGKPVLTDVKPAPNWMKIELLNRVGAVEQSSEHPLAEAIVEGLKATGLNHFPKSEHFKNMPGYGVQATVKGQEVLIGTRRLLADQQVQVPQETLLQMSGLEEQGKTTMLIAVDGQWAGMVAVADTIKDTSRQAISRASSYGH